MLSLAVYGVTSEQLQQQQQLRLSRLAARNANAHQANATLRFYSSVSVANKCRPWSQSHKGSVRSHGGAAVQQGAYTNSLVAGGKESEAPKRSSAKIRKVTNKESQTPKSASDTTKKDAIHELKVDGDEDEDEDYDWPPLVCCFGHAIHEFVPNVKISLRQMDPDAYSQWKALQWNPPDFARAPGTVSYNVAIALARLGGRVEFMGKVGNDAFGKELVYILNTNRVQTRGVRFDPNLLTGVSEMHLTHGDKQVHMSCIQGSAEDSLQQSEINIDVLKETRLFHFTSISLLRDPTRTSLLNAMDLAKNVNASIFFDVNLPLILWNSTPETWKVIREAWEKSDIVEVTKYELELLLGEDDLAYRTLYYREAAKDDRERDAFKRRRFEYHYTPEEIAPIWHDNLKILLVTDGTWRIHYYTPNFHGSVNGTEDVIVSSFSCDRTGSGDAIVAGMLRKFQLKPDLYNDQDKLKRALRFAISAGIIAQWTPGTILGFPTENATQNLLEQICIPGLI
ncbi:hypothetical protein O6H91_18G078000 [Diphasiastrum complanatum]|uniref:Uncharacterized protein n=1 Tax=Diphasiastrum complanatum TaxID=34168 RepID=A0ACC2B2V3_DIPCM|nr:hypothetical protein O6H91_18G078000 [Diphasiastrum complanatum]